MHMFLPIDMMDTGKTETGELYVKDSERNWNEFTSGVESSFQKEIRGEEFWHEHYTIPNPPKTWTEGWAYNIRRMRNGDPVLYKNPQRRIDYIHRRRAELGLPPIEE